MQKSRRTDIIKLIIYVCCAYHSIGSLGKELNEAGVQNVTLTDSVFTGSDNGVRIKSWARPSNGFVRNILFQNIVMRNVENPITIDQNYCPNNQGCPRQVINHCFYDNKYKYLIYIKKKKTLQKFIIEQMLYIPIMKVNFMFLICLFFFIDLGCED